MAWRLPTMPITSRSLVQRQKNRGRFCVPYDCINLPMSEFLAMIHLFRALLNTHSVQPLMLVMAASGRLALHLQKQIDTAGSLLALLFCVMSDFIITAGSSFQKLFANTFKINYPLGRARTLTDSACGIYRFAMPISFILEIIHCIHASNCIYDMCKRHF